MTANVFRLSLKVDCCKLLVAAEGRLVDRTL